MKADDDRNRKETYKQVLKPNFKAQTRNNWAFQIESVLDVIWLSDTTVQFYYPDKIRVFRKEESIDFWRSRLAYKI